MDAEKVSLKDTICCDRSAVSSKDFSFKVSRSAIGIAGFIQNILDELFRFDFGRDVISAFQGGGWTVALHASDNQIPRVFHSEKILSLPNDYMAATGILRSPFFKNRFVLSFLKALRHIDRLERTPWPSFLSVRSFLTAGRIEQADQTVVAIYLAYLLSDIFPDLWHHVRVMDDCDMVILTPDPQEADGDAPMVFDFEQSFHTWFKNPSRVYAADHQSLPRVDHMLQTSIDPMRYCHELTEVDIDRFCTKENQNFYLNQNTDMRGGETHPLHAAYLAQIERDQRMVIYGAVGIRDRDLAGRLFGVPK